MSGQKEAVSRIFEEYFNQGNEQVVHDVYHQAYRGYDGDRIMSFDDGIAFIRHLRRAFPNIHFEVVQLLEEGSRVLAQWTAAGTQEAEYMGIPATRSSAKIGGMTIFEFDNGRVMASYVNRDDLGLLQQLGVIPSA